MKLKIIYKKLNNISSIYKKLTLRNHQLLLYNDLIQKEINCMNNKQKNGKPEFYNWKTSCLDKSKKKSH